MTTQPDITTAIDRIQSGKADPTDLCRLLALEGDTERRQLRRAAYDVKCRTVGPVVYFRALIELSNVCRKNCYYCGIRAENKGVSRYTLAPDDVLRMATWADEQRYGSLVLQAGERQDEEFISFVEQITQTIRRETNLGITLSLGEQTDATYQRWFAAGAHRYLLRIETSNPTLYRALHPENHHFETRCACLDRLKTCGYQVGTGVMIGLPGQTIADLANDILFFRERDIDMIGMGPYLPHSETPTGRELREDHTEERLERGLNMIAVTRLLLADVNIAATTALQALAPDGRELGLMAGANVIMPNVTDTKYRAAYQLYENKPCQDENASQCRGCLQARIDAIGETIGFGKWGDAPHFGLARK